MAAPRKDDVRERIIKETEVLLETKKISVISQDEIAE